MPELIHCPNCNRQLRVPENLIGKTVKCPECNQQFTALIGSAASGVEPAAWVEPDEASASPPVVGQWPVQRRYGTGEPHRGGLILTLGILSLVVCTPLGIFAWNMGKSDLAKIKAGKMDPEGNGLTQAGYICGIVGTCLFCLQMLILCIYAIIFAAVIGGAGAGGFR